MDEPGAVDVGGLEVLKMRGNWGMDIKGRDVDGVVGHGGKQKKNDHAHNRDGDEL